MDFLKKHYEKVLLGVVLVGLAVAVAFLPFKINSEKQKLEDLANSLTHPKVKPLTNVDLTVSESAMKRIVTPASFDFSTPNKLFNPMPWQQTRDTPPRLIPAHKVGPTLSVVTNITPLYLKITLDSINVSPDGSAGYLIGVEKEAAPTPDKRKKKQTYCKLRDKNETFQLVDVKGPPDNPTNVVLILNDTGETAQITKEKAFRRVDGHMADFKYEPERINKMNLRVGAVLVFNNEQYNIVAINPNEVVLSAKSNQKKWTIKQNPTL